MPDANEKRRAAQPNRLTRDVFIARARAVHGDFYDYSQVDFVNTKTKVRIICPRHGVFLQSPEKHMAGNGCPGRECVAERQKARNLEKYGVEHFSQSDAVKAKKKATMQSRYGADNPMHVKEFKAKHDSTCEARYGSVSPLGNKAVRQKILDTMQAAHGGPGAMCDPEVREKSRQTNRERYGVDNPMQSPEVKAKLENTMILNHGVRNAMQVKEFQQKQREGQRVAMLEKYGAPNGFESEICREKAAETNLRKYGVRNVMTKQEFVDKMLQSKLDNGTINSSKPEDELYARLCLRFGKDDIVRQYKSERYPWRCDFYIKSRDMFIELNGFVSHGLHWYDESDPADRELLDKWINSGKPLLEQAAYVWSELDIAKREAARGNGLNYIVLWDDQLRDGELWFAMGCPDGKDWEREYSWLPERQFDDPPAVKGVSGNVRAISRSITPYQFYIFYHREIALWQENPVVKGLPLQVYLYWNRYKYLGKLPDRLMDLEIARGFGISGLLRKYTVFDASLMDEAVRKYDIKSVYDPCAGWGERALYCKSHGNIKYTGVDINRALFPGYEQMRQDLDMPNQQFVCGDSGSMPAPAGYGAVITCPPYGDTEIYSPDGAENLDEPDFLAWWKRVGQNCHDAGIRYFCFQVNHAWRDRMLEQIEFVGYELIDELLFQHRPVSHFNRGKNGQAAKTEKETMLILRLL